MDNVTDETFEAEVLNSETPVLVDFYTTWCRPCNLLAPKLVELAEEIAEVRFVKADVEAEPKISDKYDVQCVPSLLLFKDGKVLGRKEGVVSKPDLQKWILENTN